jgi:mRNA interferase MazF
VLLLGALPGRHADWLCCGISSRLAEATPGWDEVIAPGDPEFGASGLKAGSVIRLNWLGTVSAAVAGSTPYLGRIAKARLTRLRRRLADYLGRDTS